MFGSFQLGELGWIDSVFWGSCGFNVLSFLWNFSVAPTAKSMCQTKPETFKGFIEFYMHLWRSVVFIIKPQKKKKSGINTCGPYSDGENITLIMDERLSRAKQVQIKFGKFIVSFQKTSQVQSGRIPIFSPSTTTCFPLHLLWHWDLGHVALDLWGLERRLIGSKLLGFLCGHSFLVKFTFWNMLFLISVSCTKSHPCNGPDLVIWLALRKRLLLPDSQES